MISRFMIGAGYLVKGFGLIKQPGLRRFVLIPLLVNIVIFSLLIYIGFSQLESLVDTLLPASQSWWAQLLRIVFSILFWILAVIILFFGFTLAANLIASPFNGLMAERVQIYLTGNTTEAASGFSAALAGAGSAILSELRKYVYFGLLAIPLVVLMFIPGINFLVPLISAIFGAWMLVLEYTAYVAENAGLGFKALRTQIRRQRLMALGFGAATLVATIIPVVNFLVMPAAVAGATAMWLEQWRQT